MSVKPGKKKISSLSIGTKGGYPSTTNRMVAVLPLLPIRAFTLEDGSLALELPDHAFIIPDTLRRQLKAERTGGSKVARDVAANALALLIQNEFFDVATLAAMDAPAALAVGAIIELIAIAIADTLVA